MTRFRAAPWLLFGTALSPRAQAAAAAPSSAELARSEDDPKLARGGGLGAPMPEERAPFFKAAYRYETLPNLDRSTLTFHTLEVDLYPISVRGVRLTVEGELGFGVGTLESKPSGAWFLQTGLDIGFQYPWRVTPFVDARFIAGLIGGDVSGTSAVTWIYSFGVDAGIEVYVAGRLYVSAGAGWVHPTYNGVDLAATRLRPASPTYVTIAGDTFTFKVGVGL